GHHLFAQANSLAVAVINDELALTSKTELTFKRQVKLHEQVVAKAEVIHVHLNDNTTVEVYCFVKYLNVIKAVYHNIVELLIYRIQINNKTTLKEINFIKNEIIITGLVHMYRKSGKKENS